MRALRDFFWTAKAFKGRCKKEGQVIMEGENGPRKSEGY